MQTYTIQQDSDRVVMSNTPFKEKGVRAQVATVTKTALENYKKGTSDLYIEDGKLKEKASTRKADADAAKAAAEAAKTAAENRKKELLDKVTDGTATKSEKDEFLTLI